MKWIKIIEVLLIILSAVCYLASHMFQVLLDYTKDNMYYGVSFRVAYLFGIPIPLSLVVDIFFIISMVIPFVLIIIVLRLDKD